MKLVPLAVLLLVVVLLVVELYNRRTVKRVEERLEIWCRLNESAQKSAERLRGKGR